MQDSVGLDAVSLARYCFDPRQAEVPTLIEVPLTELLFLSILQNPSAWFQMPNKATRNGLFAKLPDNVKQSFPDKGVWYFT